LNLKVSSKENNFLVTIATNNTSVRGKQDIVCILDNSGSMGEEALVKNVATG
jgi:hypothetical protein